MSILKDKYFIEMDTDNGKIEKIGQFIDHVPPKYMLSKVFANQNPQVNKYLTVIIGISDYVDIYVFEKWEEVIQFLSKAPAIQENAIKKDNFLKETLYDTNHLLGTD